MEYHEIQTNLETIHRLTAEIEDRYIESDGEVTPEAEALEQEKEAIAYLLQNDGIDALGRWLKLKEDETKMWKAEKAAADRKIKSSENTIAFIKEKIAEIMKATGMEKAKGTYYSFSRYESAKSTVKYEDIERVWGPRVYTALEGIGFPGWMEIQFKTTTTALKEAGEDEFIDTVTGDAVRFTKPRGSKE